MINQEKNTAKNHTFSILSSNSKIALHFKKFQKVDVEEKYKALASNAIITTYTTNTCQSALTILLIGLDNLNKLKAMLI